MEYHFSRTAAIKILDELLFAFGVISYIETVQVQSEKVNVEQKKHQFPMEMPFFPEIADINSFTVGISFIKFF
jgi:hypothetical protein